MVSTKSPKIETILPPVTCRRFLQLPAARAVTGRPILPPCGLAGLLSVLIIVLARGIEFAFPKNPEPRNVDTLYSEAREAKARGDVQGAIEKLQAILKVNAQMAPVYNNLGVLYFEQGKLRDAAQAFEEGLRLDKNMSSALAPLGVSYYQMGQLDKARQVLETAVHLKPDDTTAQLYLGHTLFDLGQQEAGTAALHKLIHQSPNDLRALYELGGMHLKMAQGILKQLEALAPDSYLVRLSQAQMMEGMGNYDGALVQYKKAAAQQPNLPYAHYYIGNVYWLMRKWEEATAEFRQEIAANPYDCLAYGQLGNILVKAHGDPVQARSYIESALDLCPDLTQARTDYGLLLAEHGEYENAIQQYKRVVQLSPEDESVHLLLGRAYQKLGRADEANAEYAIAQNLQKKRSEQERSRRQDVGGVK